VNTFLIVMGWIFTGLLIALALRYIGTRVTANRRPRKRPQVGDDVIAMIRRQRDDDKLVAVLERELAEMDKRIRGDLGG